jgi:tRNA(adenine34) deaminase
MVMKKKWSAKVDTDSTHPDGGLFTKSPPAIAKALASKKVSPKGPGSGMRMLTFYINRAGKNLPKERHAALEKAKTILSEMIAAQKEKEEPAATKKSPANESSVKKTSQRPAKKVSRTSRTKKKAAKKAA